MLLKQLSNAFGVSGAEGEVRDILRQDLRNIGKTQTDALGNLFVVKASKYDMPKLMLCAHMDEVGFIVTGYNDDGMIKFSPVGGIDPRVLPGKRVLVGENSFNKYVTKVDSDKNYSVYYRAKDKQLVIKREEYGTVDQQLIAEGYVKYYSHYNGRLVENTYTESKFRELFEKRALEFSQDKIYEKNYSEFSFLYFFNSLFYQLKILYHSASL